MRQFLTICLSVLVLGTTSFAQADTKVQSASFRKLYQNTKIMVIPEDTRMGASLMRDVREAKPQDDTASLPHGFSPAPLPDDDMSAPVVKKDDTEPYLKPQFYHRRIANANGMQANAHDSENRRGHGDLSGGVALTVPLPQ